MPERLEDIQRRHREARELSDATAIPLDNPGEGPKLGSYSENDPELHQAAYMPVMDPEDQP